MKLTVVCDKCGKILSVIEKDAITQEDVDMYTKSSSCPDDDTYSSIPILDDDGNPVLDDDGNPTFKSVRISYIATLKTVK